MDTKTLIFVFFKIDVRKLNASAMHIEIML